MTEQLNMHWLKSTPDGLVAVEKRWLRKRLRLLSIDSTANMDHDELYALLPNPGWRDCAQPTARA